MKEGHYKITTNQYTFDMTISKFENIYTIRYGDATNREGPCVELTYDLTTPSKLKLDNLEYKTHCSDGGNLKRGEGTIHMIQSVLKLLMSQFPKLSKVSLHDVATIQCKQHSVSLAYIYVLCYGTTWYGKYLHAKPKNKDIKRGLDDLQHTLSQDPHARPLGFKPSSDHTTWYDYFQSKKDSKDCMFFWDNMPSIKALVKVPLTYSEWYVSRKHIDKYEDVHITLISKTTDTRNHHKGGSTLRPKGSHGRWC